VKFQKPAPVKTALFISELSPHGNGVTFPREREYHFGLGELTILPCAPSLQEIMTDK
jgi:hypothetical protein